LIRYRAAGCDGRPAVDEKRSLVLRDLVGAPSRREGDGEGNAESVCIPAPRRRALETAP
jgi:hypothetical protein